MGLRMNKDVAWMRLGLSGHEDKATIARLYGERLSQAQERLVTAQDDAERSASQTALSELVQAFEFVTATGRYTQASNDSGTVLRSDLGAPASAHDTLIRMEPGVLLSGRFEVGPMLGQGGMGNVYAARDRLKDEGVAIKVLRQDLLFSDAAKDRFLAEAKVSCNLSHPNIVRVYDVGMSGDYYYFSMERLKGHTLRQRIEDYEASHRQFGMAEVTEIARQLIDALRYAHRYIVHRDLKPENIWLAEDGTVKLMDFGIARAYSNSQLTQTGMTLGTAYYMAPEQRAASKDVDWRADQYALGVVLYELLSGTLPTGAVTALETIRRDLPKRYARALMKAMAPKPADRFDSFDELWAELQVPARKFALGLGGLLLLGAGAAAAAAGAFMVYRQAPSVSPQIAVVSEPALAPAGASPSASSAAGELGAGADSLPAEGSFNGSGAGAGNTGGGPAGPSSQAAAGMLAVPASQSPDSSAAVAASVSPDTPVANTAAQPGSGSGGGAPAAAQRRVAVAVPDTSRREACVAQCERDEGECRSLNRRGRQECMRAVGFNSAGGVTTTNPAAANCAFFGAARCDFALDRGECLARVSARQQACVEVLGGTVASRRQDCEVSARDADRFCLDELRECRASCER